MQYFIKDFLGFLRKSIPSILIIFFFLSLSFGQLIFNSSFSIDTEHYLYNYNDSFNWWLSLDRWGLVLFNSFLNFTPLIPSVSNFLCFTMMLIYSLLFNYLFYLIINDKWKSLVVKFQFIFSIIFLTNPIFAEQYNFVNQNFAVSFGISLIPISLIILHYSDFTTKKFKRIILTFFSILFSIFSFGIYQSLISLYILSVVCCCFINIVFNNDNSYKYIIKRLSVFLIVFTIYMCICNAVGPHNSYLNNAWKTNSFSVCLINIYSVIINMLKCKTIFYNVSYYFALFFMLLILIFMFIKKSFRFNLFITSLGLALSPFYIMIFTGVDQLKRTQFNYSFFIGFMFLIFFLIIYNSKIVNRLVCFVLVFLSVAIAYKQSYITSNLFYSDFVRFNYDSNLGNNIQSRIESKDEYDKDLKYTIIFLGHYYNRPINSFLAGEVMGSSFFEFDYKEIYGVNQRANIFFKTLGFDYNFCSKEDFEWAKKYVKKKNIPSFPNEKSIFIYDNKIVIRLSDDI